MLYWKWFVVRCPVWASSASTQFCRVLHASSLSRMLVSATCHWEGARTIELVPSIFINRRLSEGLGCPSERRYWEIHEMGKVCLQVPFFLATVMRQGLHAGLCPALWIFAVFEGCTEPQKCVFFSTTWLFSSIELSSTGDSSSFRHNG